VDQAVFEHAIPPIEQARRIEQMLVNRKIRDANFRATYNAAVVAVHRGGERIHGGLHHRQIATHHRVEDRRSHTWQPPTNTRSSQGSSTTSMNIHTPR
jgi:hypothetical protein